MQVVAVDDKLWQILLKSPTVKLPLSCIVMRYPAFVDDGDTKTDVLKGVVKELLELQGDGAKLADARDVQLSPA